MAWFLPVSTWWVFINFIRIYFWPSLVCARRSAWCWTIWQVRPAVPACIQRHQYGFSGASIAAPVCAIQHQTECYIYALYLAHPKPPEHLRGVALLTSKHPPITKNVLMCGANDKDQCVLLDFDNCIISMFSENGILLGKIDFLDPQNLILDTKINFLCHV